MAVFVNSTAVTIATPASTWSIATHSSRVGGAGYVVGLGRAGDTFSGVTQVTDNLGTAYSTAVQFYSVNYATLELWYAPSVSSNSTRIHVTFAANASGSIAVGQWTGFPPTVGVTGSSESSPSSAISTSHSASEITPTLDNSLVVMFGRMSPSTGSPNALDGGQSEWCSTGQAVRTIGGYIVQAGASTATGQWRTGAGTAGSSGRVGHSAIIAAFGAPAVTDYYAPYQMLSMGVQ